MSAVAFTAPHRRASEIGLAVLEEGGSEVDAIIAGAAAISVLYPQMNSLAGDGFWLIHSPGERPKAIDACGTAAQLASIDGYREQGCTEIPSRGALSALTLGVTLTGWQRTRDIAERKHALLPLMELLRPAIALARKGITVTDSLAAASRKVSADLSDQPEYQRIFTDRGAPLTAGALLKNPDLRALLEHLGHSGLDSFYRGELAQHLAGELERAGSPIRTPDLAGYQASVVTPLGVNNRFGRCYNLPPPTQGLASLLILALDDRMFRSEWSEAERVHALVEATKQAFIVRDREVADPAQMVRRPEHWLSELELKFMAAQVGEQAQPWPHTAEPGDTVWMGAKDQQGTMVSFIQSIYWEFGSGLVIPDTGAVWNNPAVALLKDGRRISYGCIGGEGRPQTQDALLTRYLYDGLPLDEAISRGRWLLGRTWGDSDDDLKLEQDLAGSVGKNLAQRRHRIKVLPTHSELMGHAGAPVALPNGPVTAASDARSDGVVLVGRIR